MVRAKIMSFFKYEQSLKGGWQASPPGNSTNNIQVYITDNRKTYDLEN